MLGVRFARAALSLTACLASLACSTESASRSGDDAGAHDASCADGSVATDGGILCVEPNATPSSGCYAVALHPTTAAPDGGYCCAVGVNATRSCGGPPIGGWSATVEGCCDFVWQQRSDLPYTEGVDGHGCHILIPDYDEHHCCNCPCGMNPMSCSDYDAGRDAADAADGD